MSVAKKNFNTYFLEKRLVLEENMVYLFLLEKREKLEKKLLEQEKVWIFWLHTFGDSKP